VQSGSCLVYTGLMARNSKNLDIPLAALASNDMPVRPYVGVYNIEMKLISSSKNNRTDAVAQLVRIAGRKPSWGDSVIDHDADAQVLELNGEPVLIVVGASDAKAARGMGMAAIVDLL